MAVEDIKVGIGEWKIAREPQRLITLGLGSCVGVALYDQRAAIGGLAHVMLPDSKQFQEITNRAKFADLAIPDLVEEMLRWGASKGSIIAKVAGGAQMFSSADHRLTTLNIGERNATMVLKTLQALGIPVVAQDTGGNYGRTMILDTASGKVFIRALGRPLREI